MEVEKNNILNENNYTKLVVENEHGEKIAEITSTDATSAEGYSIRLTPNYDYSDKKLLVKLLEQQEKTNELLQTIVDSKEPSISLEIDAKKISLGLSTTIDDILSKG